MEPFLILVFWVLNFGISWFNAWAVGRSWADSKVIGGWPRFITWCAATMSVVGFTWCYLVVLAILAGSFSWLEPQYVRATLELGYVIIVLPLLGSGLGIWIDSVTTAWRQRDIASVGVAAWNTFAQAHNAYAAVTSLRDIFGHLGDVFDDDDLDAKIKLFVVFLVVLAVVSGILTTVAIVRTTAQNYSQEVLLSGTTKGIRGY